MIKIQIFFILFLIGNCFNCQNLFQSSFCNVNVFCEPEFCDQRRSVVMVLFLEDGEYKVKGTGFLINNEKGDGTPYLLTASHLFDPNKDDKITHDELNNIDFENVKILFNYQFSDCSHLIIPSNSEFIIGLSFVSYVGEVYGTGSGDWMLLRLNSEIPNDYNTYFNGFSISDKKPNNITFIHHPNGDVKKITKTDKKPQRKIYSWVVKKWDSGTVENGSSGGPFFNEDKRVVGIEYSVDGLPCSKKNDTYASRLDVAWDNNSDVNNQLKHWLGINAPSNFLALGGLEPCRYSWNFQNANDLHTSDNINPLLDFPNNFHQYGTRAYNGVYNASGVITAGNNVEIISNTSVEFYGNTIHLKPGFKASAGSYFHAKPQPCLRGCNNGKSSDEDPSFVFSNSKNPQIVDELEEDVEELSIDDMYYNYSNSIYPNPTSSILNIEVSEEFLGGELRIYDILGNQVWIETIKSNRFTIDNFANLSEGVYTILLSKDEYFESQKVVKQ